MNLKWVKRFLLVILLLIIIYVYVGNIGVIRDSIEQSVADKTVNELTQGNEVGQSFIYHQNNLSGVSIKLATFMRVNEGKLKIGIRRINDKNDIYQTSVEANSVRDNEFFDFRFPPIKFSKEQEYYVYIESLDSGKGESIAAYKSSMDSYKEGSLFINGSRQDGDLTFKVFYNRTIFNYIGEKWNINF
ncbi:hypothetical protein [Paenibacillus sp. FSL R5-0912]|uniref:hypothetical protein n=1 Tax=Paenibacillus sp. FSL R5-0912 TaxID=1536771 RepID=UPI0004F91CCB|nr:hypothetical protein [Paenibacillus sp. FSL R5-0912]AIQ43948.1 hypothetical protein R50912_31130 [Paenibacillus sp. FSL R5-0912]